MSHRENVVILYLNQFHDLDCGVTEYWGAPGFVHYKKFDLVLFTVLWIAQCHGALSHWRDCCLVVHSQNLFRGADFALICNETGRYHITGSSAVDLEFH